MNRILATNIDTQIPEDDIKLLKAMAHPLWLHIINELTNKKTLNVTQLQKFWIFHNLQHLNIYLN